MLKLKSIRLRNWSRAASAEIVFPERGMVFLRGINHADHEGTSNGAGKTQLGEAINRALLGRSLVKPLIAYSLHREGNTYVDVQAELRGMPLRVELGYRCPEFPGSKGEGLRYTIGSEKPIERSDPAQTRAELTELIGVSPEVSMWTIFLDGERLKFSTLPQDDALSLLMQALNQPPWGLYRERAERRRDAAKEKLTAAKAKLEQLQLLKADIAEEVEQAREGVARASAAWDEASTRWTEQKAAHDAEVQKCADEVLAASNEIKRLKLAIKKAEAADAETCGKIELELSRLSSERRTTETYLRGWMDTVATDRTQLEHAQADYDAMQEGKSCPTCHRSFAEKASAEQLAAAKRSIEKKRATLQESVKGRDECSRVLDEVDRDIAEKHKERTQLRSASIGPLSRELETADTRLSVADRRLRDTERRSPAPPSDASLVQARNRLADLNKRQVANEQAVQSAAAALAAAETSYSISQYWVKGFSPEGIPNIVLRRTVGPLNDAAKLVSASLSGGLVQIAFSAETELANGSMKPKLVTEVQTRHGATEFQRNSKGEGSFANLIIAETQTQVGRVLQRVGYRWFDEVANSLSGTARRTLYTGLKQQASDLGLLTFVVDHHDEAVNCADHILVAEKSTEGLTTYRWE